MSRLTPVVGPESSLAAALAALPVKAELSREFPVDALAEAEAAARDPDLPDRDATDVPFVTIDPPGSTDLDQALHLERDGDGWMLRYAIADVPAFVRPGGPLDAEARRRGSTVYLPDGRIPLHPPVLSEGAASLLPGELRSAYVWEIRLDARGATTAASVARARVRSTAQLDYAGVQALIDTGTATGSLGLLREVGEARLALERERGGASLNTPETLIEPDGAGYRLVRREVLPVERWNAQLSLLTGMEAARLMLAGRVGILRTMPPADQEAIDAFRRRTVALGEPWPEDEAYGAYLARLTGSDPAHLAIMHAAGSLFRGAAYTPLDGAEPENAVQAAVGAPYAHVTAPLRRLVDRFGLVVCAALSAGEEVPGWAREALPELPKLMARSDNVAGQVDRQATDIVEAAVLAGRVGEEFAAAVVAPGRIQLADPPVDAPCEGADEPGVAIRARLVQADIPTGTVRFTAA